VESFIEAMEAHILAANARLAQLDADPLDPTAATQAYVEAAERLRPFLRDTSSLVNDALRAGQRILCEGAQGTLLDIDHGDYPFVTSSSPTAGGALIGLGFGPTYVDRVIGVAKAYATRVGGGPFPTELDGPLAERLRGTGQNFWDEYGTTTGRPRRCGWFDAVLLRYTAQVSGFTELVLTKLDILSGFEAIRIAVAYELDGKRLDTPPATVHELERVTPVYETLPGWSEDVTAARQPDDLPRALLEYAGRISTLAGVPVSMVSVGPEREQLVRLRP
jgi:adenylosuccinate synthase